MEKGFLEYEDILEDRRNSSDLRWAAQEWHEDVENIGKEKLAGKNFIASIMKSERIKHIIDREVQNADGCKREQLEKKVFDILQEMCHDQDIGVIRKFALPLAKIMKKIYGSVYVNIEGVKKLKKQFRGTPVIFLPTHRSYADFILVSYLAFHYHLPFPIIAAGMDFMTMAVIGDMLRGAGAFYIRRSFSNDNFYWIIFKEFVQQLTCHSGQPVEFFLEGTRSRTGKTLVPKIGLLSCVVECWLRGMVPDVLVVPISISYNRTLEEDLFAYELLGVAKPKESTSGLLKAMTILKESYGDVFVRFGDVMYVSEFFPSNLLQINLAPPFATSITVSEYDACESFGLSVCRRMETNSVVTFWSTTCLVLLVNIWKGRTTIPFKILTESVLVVATLLKNLGAILEDTLSLETVTTHLRRALVVHRKTIELQNGEVIILRFHCSKEHDSLSGPKDEFTLRVVAHLILQYYANQTLHFFIRPALVVMAIGHSINETFDRFVSLVDIFSFDFIFEKRRKQNDFDEAVKYLKNNQLASVESGKIETRNLFADVSVASFFYDVLRPFVFNYKTALRASVRQSFWKNEVTVVSTVQKELRASAEKCGVLSALSLDTCRHGVKMMLKLGGLCWSTSGVDGNAHLVSVAENIRKISTILGDDIDQLTKAKL